MLLIMSDKNVFTEIQLGKHVVEKDIGMELVSLKYTHKYTVYN